MLFIFLSFFPLRLCVSAQASFCPVATNYDLNTAQIKKEPFSANDTIHSSSLSDSNHMIARLHPA